MAEKSRAEMLYGPYRKVVRYEKWRVINTRNGYTTELTLECGHTKHQKGSIRVPRKSRCAECGYVARLVTPPVTA